MNSRLPDFKTSYPRTYAGSSTNDRAIVSNKGLVAQWCKGYEKKTGRKAILASTYAEGAKKK